MDVVLKENAVELLERVVFNNIHTPQKFVFTCMLTRFYVIEIISGTATIK